MLFFAAILTSIDCFIIGLSLKIEQKKLSMDKLLCLPLFLFIFYWMGYSYYIFAFFIYVLVFYFFSSLVSTKLQFIIPIPIIIALLKYMTYFNNSTGIFKSLNLILRNGMQDILLYVILFGVIRLIIRQK